MAELFSRLWSPYQMNPVNYHPLRDILVEQVNFDKLRRASDLKLFVCASNVTTNRLRVFKREEISVEAVLASTPAFRISGNRDRRRALLGWWLHGQSTDLSPHLRMQLARCRSCIDQSHTDRRRAEKLRMPSIDRINTLSFNSSLMREMRAIAFVSASCGQGL